MLQASLNLNHSARLKKHFVLLPQLHQVIKHIVGLYFWRGKVSFLKKKKN